MELHIASYPVAPIFLNFQILPLVPYHWYPVNRTSQEMKFYIIYVGNRTGVYFITTCFLCSVKTLARRFFVKGQFDEKNVNCIANKRFWIGRIDNKFLYIIFFLFFFASESCSCANNTKLLKNSDSFDKDSFPFIRVGSTRKSWISLLVVGQRFIQKGNYFFEFCSLLILTLDFFLWNRLQYCQTSLD